MRADRARFTRGSQLLESFSLMFLAGLRPMLWALFGIFSATLGWGWWTRMGEGDWYRCLMKAYAWLWDYIKLDPNKQLAILDAMNQTIMIPVRYVHDFPSVVDAWDRFTGSIATALVVTLFVGLPLCVAYTVLARRIGTRIMRREHLRGANICTGTELKRRVCAFNAEQGKSQREAELERLYGPMWRAYALVGTTREKARGQVYLPYTIAGIPYPWHGEQTHTFAIGTTGSGKSTAIKELVDQIRARHAKAVIFDLTGSFIQSYYDPARDIILNPLDTRCPQWSIFADCETRSEFTAAAEALVPNDGGTSEPFWVIAARTLLIEGCLRLKQMGQTSNQALHDYIMTAALSAVNRLVQNTIAAPLTDPEAARMAESIRSTLNTNAAALQTLPQEGPNFSVKDWVQGDHPDGSILFVSARYVDLPTVRILLTLWLDTAINAMMAMPTSPHNVRLWFLFDELGALHRLPAIEKGMQTARNFGGAFLLGVHTISKLRETYGEKIADTLASLARTKLILATPDYASAQWCSQQIGQSEWQQMEQGLSYGYANVRDAVTLTNKRQTEPLVMPDEIMKMRDLDGWLVFPQDLPAGKITLRFKARPDISRPFVQRPSNDIVPPADSPSPAAPQQSAPPQGAPAGGAANTDGTALVTTQNAEGSGNAGDSDAGGLGAASGAPILVMHPDDLPKDAPLSDVADAALTAAVIRAGQTAPVMRGPAAAAPVTAPAQGEMKLARIAGPAQGARDKRGAEPLPPHDPVTGEILPEQAKSIGGLDISIVAEPEPPAPAQAQTEDLSVTESRQNFTPDRGDDDLGLGG
jgi:type IV conjugative transfer system coupling protein TraD